MWYAVWEHAVEFSERGRVHLEIALEEYGGLEAGPFLDPPPDDGCVLIVLLARIQASRGRSVTWLPLSAEEHRVLEAAVDQAAARMNARYLSSLPSLEVSR